MTLQNRTRNKHTIYIEPQSNTAQTLRANELTHFEFITICNLNHQSSYLNALFIRCQFACNSMHVKSIKARQSSLSNASRAWSCFRSGRFVLKREFTNCCCYVTAWRAAAHTEETENWPEMISSSWPQHTLSMFTQGLNWPPGSLCVVLA